MRRCCVRVMRLGRRQAARSRTEFLDSQRAHAAADAREYAPETAALRTAADSPTHPFGDDRQSLLPDPAYEAYTSDGIDGNSNFEVNTIWCAMGTPAPDACLSHEIVSGNIAGILELELLCRAHGARQRRRRRRCPQPAPAGTGSPATRPAPAPGGNAAPAARPRPPGR